MNTRKFKCLLLGHRWSNWAEILKVILYFFYSIKYEFFRWFFLDESLPLTKCPRSGQPSTVKSDTKISWRKAREEELRTWRVEESRSWGNGESMRWRVEEHGRIVMGGHGLLKLSLGPAMPYPSTPCRRATSWLFEGWPACRAGDLRPSSNPLNTPCRTPMSRRWNFEDLHSWGDYIGVREMWWWADD
jgi:hypothetical protein